MAKIVAMISQYQSGKWIKNRIENILQSNFKDIEIWCVNANSPDSLDNEIPLKYDVKYVKLTNKLTVYETWNYIIKNSDSEYLINANTDDITSPSYYDEMIEALEKTKSGFAYPSWYNTAIENQQWPPKIETCSVERPGHYNGDLQKAGVGHFPMWRRSLHDKLGLFDEQYKALGDAEWWARCYYIAGTKFTWVDKKLACYLWRNGDNLWQREISSDEWQKYHESVNRYKNVSTI